MDNLSEVPNVPATGAGHSLGVSQPSAAHKDKPPARLGLLAGKSRSRDARTATRQAASVPY